MHHLERRFHSRDIESRTVRPFEWGLEHFEDRQITDDPRDYIRDFNSRVIPESDTFFRPDAIDPGAFDFDGFWLKFPSAVTTPYEKNNTAQGRFYRAEAGDRAVIISPQWNADLESHVALCRGLNRFGISALRLSLPYHDRRMPDELTRADYMVSANIGLTVQSVRQAVLDIRRAADWLWAQGFRKVGVMGTSIGSCVSWLAFIHDERFETGVFNMVSSWFGDVVWRALTTSHIRQALEEELTAEEVREAWLSISPSAYSARLSNLRRPSLLISTRYDLTFLPDLARIFFEDCDRNGVPTRKKLLSCGHYTIGQTPFKFIDGWHIINHFRRGWN